MLSPKGEKLWPSKQIGHAMTLRSLQWPDWDESPPPLDYVLPGLLAGTVGALVSPGGMGKSMLILQLLLLVASANDLIGLGGEWGTGPVTYMPAEDPDIAIQHRLHALKSHLTAEQYEMARERISIHPLVGTMPDLNDDHWRSEIRKVADGRRLLVIDTLRRFHRADENHSGEMAEVVARLEAIAAESGCTIIFLHHAAKAAALNGHGDQQQASRGASVLTDNIRWQAYLIGMTAETAKELDVDPEQRGHFVKFGLSKVNYGAPTAEKWLRRHPGGVLLPDPNLQLKASSGKRRVKHHSGREPSALDIAMRSEKYRTASRGT
ncbi:plasmid and phage replicative helicase [Solimonas aquatica]|uniref:Plasmid and phage replicative helicase n=2 Tax=Nevskiaceae TaxID=568386 RepID=A0A1H9DUK0_9GAMM|nr:MULTISPECIES: helicase RepA family protein [Solimonas]SEQ17125.1 plasmid and phage replicative helicase [Solimonas aquatica]